MIIEIWFSALAESLRSQKYFLLIDNRKVTVIFRRLSFSDDFLLDDKIKIVEFPKAGLRRHFDRDKSLELQT